MEFDLRLYNEYYWWDKNIINNPKCLADENTKEVLTLSDIQEIIECSIDDSCYDSKYLDKNPF